MNGGKWTRGERGKLPEKKRDREREVTPCCNDSYIRVIVLMIIMNNQCDAYSNNYVTISYINIHRVRRCSTNLRTKIH